MLQFCPYLRYFLLSFLDTMIVLQFVFNFIYLFILWLKDDFIKNLKAKRQHLVQGKACLNACQKDQTPKYSLCPQPDNQKK